MLFRSRSRARRTSGIASWALPVAALCIALTGCSTGRKYSFYSEPRANIPAASQITGDKTAGGSSYLLAVDGLPVHNENCGHDRHTRVVSGTHSLEVGFISGLNYTRTKMFVDVPPNDELVIKHRREEIPVRPVESSFEEPGETYEPVTLWLESTQTGKKYAQTRLTKLFIHQNVFMFPFVFPTIGVLIADCP